MKAFFRISASMLLLSMLLHVSRADGNVTHSKLNEICGRLILASLRFPPSAFNSVISNGETVEAVLSEIENSGQWKLFSFNEKREIAVCVLFYCDSQGGENTQFSQMLGADGPKIGESIRAIDDVVLLERFGFGRDGLKKLRQRCAFVTGSH